MVTVVVMIMIIHVITLFMVDQYHLDLGKTCGRSLPVWSIRSSFQEGTKNTTFMVRIAMVMIMIGLD